MEIENIQSLAQLELQNDLINEAKNTDNPPSEQNTREIQIDRFRELKKLESKLYHQLLEKEETFLDTQRNIKKF